MDGLNMKYFVLNSTKNDAYGKASRMAIKALSMSDLIRPSVSVPYFRSIVIKMMAFIKRFFRMNP